MKCQCGSHSLPAAHLDAFGIGVAWPKKNHEGFKAQHPRPRVPRSMAACFTRLVYEAEAFPTSPCRWETPAWLQLDLSRVQKCLIKAKWNKGLWILGEGLPGGFCCQPSRLTRRSPSLQHGGHGSCATTSETLQVTARRCRGKHILFAVPQKGWAVPCNVSGLLQLLNNSLGAGGQLWAITSALGQSCLHLHHSGDLSPTPAIPTGLTEP